MTPLVEAAGLVKAYAGPAGPLAVLRGLDWSKAKPRLLICETARPGEESRGAEIAQFVEAQGYRKITTLGCNDVYESTSGSV